MTPTPTPTLYGIPNCDTVKKARTWLDTHGIAYTFHDYKKLGADREKLAAWAGEVGWEKLLNRAGTTFRKLSDADRADIDQAKAIALMVAQPSLIKRPVVEGAQGLLVGFKPEMYEAAFA
ncbi:ArsC family reductase [uncultured Sphingomonas sp.]|uniref:ArsC family reductase n=1 Tax=uncultured Sphingomonas sp. TaxID=158754 RepID=UPI0025E1829F|nr:ArsC family reductase [uncultured Sphingomonas sp.]